MICLKVTPSGVLCVRSRQEHYWGLEVKAPQLGGTRQGGQNKVESTSLAASFFSALLWTLAINVFLSERSKFCSSCWFLCMVRAAPAPAEHKTRWRLRAIHCFYHTHTDTSVRSCGIRSGSTLQLLVSTGRPWWEHPVQCACSYLLLPPSSSAWRHTERSSWLQR